MDYDKEAPVVVLGTTENVTVDIGRSLRIASIPGFVVNPYNRKLVLRSRLFDRVFTIEKPELDGILWFNKLNEIGKSLYSEFSRKILIIPTDDRDLRLLSQFEEELSRFFVIPSTTVSVRLEDVFDKSYVESKIRTIKRPKSLLYEGSKDILEQIDFSPIIVKVSARDTKNTFVREQGKFKIFGGKKDLEIFLDEVGTSYGNLILQQFIKKSPSNEFSWIGYVSQGGTLTGITVRKTRQIPVGSQTTFAEMVRNIDLQPQASSIASKIGFWGICEIEFLFNKDDNEFYFLELNPRPCRWFFLTMGIGLNLLKHIYVDVNNENKEIKTTTASKLECKWVDLRTDFHYHVLKKTDIPGNLPIRLIRWACTIPGCNLTYITRLDPWVNLIELKRFIVLLINFFIRRIDSKSGGEMDLETVYKFS